MAQQDEGRVAVIWLDRFTLSGLIDLPEGMQITETFTTPGPPHGVGLVVVSDQLQPVPLGAEPPRLPGTWRAERLMHEGKNYTRFNWTTGRVLA